ncbi:hypothetical protein [Neobacillus sp. PS3-40]|uniref:hypothetical protein n=1 Tax=Neobacillus sp. PS3-40 TaxID=3070679 RepID=UPI0027DFC795|nr:hypothetical protein [Neobacillus sp. PS3-40]WML44996.1 hypothetical protein RCG20_03575 [Neobacillus sp. PS3-40]
MTTFQIWKEAFIDDVNKDDSKTILLIGNITNGLFFFIKWAGIPFMLYLLWVFSNL